jgi:hypothetical protein
MMNADTNDLALKAFRPASLFFARNRNLFPSEESFKKRLERRHSNGLASIGAVIETSLGLMINGAKFKEWLLRPDEFYARRRHREAAA